MIRPCFALLLLAALLGCAGMQRVMELPTGGIARILPIGDVPVLVTGAPFASLPPEALMARVVAAMPGGLGAGVRFVAWPPAAAPPVDRVVWRFGAGLAGGDGSPVCQAGGGGPPQDASIRPYAAICRGPSALAAVQAAVDGVQGPDDPAFAALIRTATLALWRPPRPDGGRRGW